MTGIRVGMTVGEVPMVAVVAEVSMAGNFLCASTISGLRPGIVLVLFCGLLSLVTSASLLSLVNVHAGVEAIW